MEIWDILDENGAPMGRTMVRGDAMLPGEYYLAVHIWIRNSAGEYLIQKRSAEKTLWPGMWAATGGAALAGESSLDAALREVGEELGIAPDPNRIAFLGRIKRHDWFTDLWMMDQEVPAADIVMQPGEVDDVRWACPDLIREMALRNEFVGYCYLDDLFRGMPIRYEYD